MAHEDRKCNMVAFAAGEYARHVFGWKKATVDEVLLGGLGDALALVDTHHPHGKFALYMPDGEESNEFGFEEVTEEQFRQEAADRALHFVRSTPRTWKLEEK